MVSRSRIRAKASWTVKLWPCLYWTPNHTVTIVRNCRWVTVGRKTIMAMDEARLCLHQVKIRKMNSLFPSSQTSLPERLSVCIIR